MPILEAGLAGLPVFCTDQVPAANEIGGQDVVRFSPNADPDSVANLIASWMENSPVFRLRRRVRRELTWRGIFQQQILPLLDLGKR
jgi:glycosyltransferase involved in cell wall biosynthesis